MCQQVVVVSSANKMKATSSIKQVLKMLFKKQHRHSNDNKVLTHSMESVDNLRNTQIEDEEVYYAEIDENAANEKLAHITASHNEQQQVEFEVEAKDEEDVYVPVRFARTNAGTFFWTTNLQPVTSIAVPAVDIDLVQPAYCYSSQQYPFMQYQDRWAQA